MTVYSKIQKKGGGGQIWEGGGKRKVLNKAYDDFH